MTTNTFKHDGQHGCGRLSDTQLKSQEMVWANRLSSALRDRDQAKEQVKTLLAACKRFCEFSFTDYEAKFNTTAAIGRLVMLKREARKAIASVESEGK